MKRPCIECGEPTDGTRCPQHRLQAVKKLSAQQRGYDTTWRALSERLRAQQPFCSICGSTEDLTLDHSPEAWHRRAEGKVIRPQDVQVLCRPCNAKKGKARPTGGHPDEPTADSRGQAGSRSHTGGPR